MTTWQYGEITIQGIATACGEMGMIASTVSEVNCPCGERPGSSPLPRGTMRGECRAVVAAARKEGNVCRT